MEALKIIFAGTPEFAAIALQALLDSPHQIIAVYTQPDRPAGRGQKLTASPVKELALLHQLPVHQPLSLRDATEQKILADYQADLMIVVAYGMILPLPVLKTPKLGCMNIHASLLPRWRGAAPIQRAILAGDSQTGVTIMQMDEGLDTGAMLFKAACDIQATDTSEIVHDRLAMLGAKSILETLDHLTHKTLKLEVQNNALATYAHKIKKEEALLDWKATAEELDRKIRAFNPWPMAYTSCDGETIRIWEAEIISAAASSQQGRQLDAAIKLRHDDGGLRRNDMLPGSIVSEPSPQGIDVLTGNNGILRLKKIQFSGGRALAVSEILHSRRLFFTKGKVFGVSASDNNLKTVGK